MPFHRSIKFVNKPVKILLPDILPDFSLEKGSTQESVSDSVAHACEMMCNVGKKPVFKSYIKSVPVR